jgi:hypothetical protein
MPTGYWDPVIERLKKLGYTVYDNRPPIDSKYARSTYSDGTIGLHDSANSKFADPTNPDLRRYDIAAGQTQEGPWVSFYRRHMQRPGSVANANSFAGPQIAYAGPHGQMPPDRVNNALTTILDYTKTNSPFGPGTTPKYKGHGELFKSDPRYSIAGREVNEALWGQNWRDGTSMVPPVPKNVAMANRGLTTHAGLTPPKPQPAVPPTLTDVGPQNSVQVADAMPSKYATSPGKPLTLWPHKVALPGTPAAPWPDVEIGVPELYAPPGAPTSGGGIGAGNGSSPQGGFAMASASKPMPPPTEQARPVGPPTQMARAAPGPSEVAAVGAPTNTMVASSGMPPLRGTVTPGPQAAPPPTAVASAPTPPPPAPAAPAAPAAPPTQAMPAQGAFSMAGLGKGITGLAGAFGGGDKQQEKISQMQAKMNQDAISYEEQRSAQAQKWLKELAQMRNARRMV